MSAYLDRPTIPAGMTCAEYRHALYGEMNHRPKRRAFGRAVAFLRRHARTGA